MKQQARNIGLQVTSPSPQTEHTDAKDPFFGQLGVRKRTFTGVVLSSKAQKSAVVGWERRYYLPKYERFEKRKTRLQVHNPISISAKEGDIVKIAATRPLSKTKNFVIVEKVGVSAVVKGEDVTAKKKDKDVKETKTQAKPAAKQSEQSSDVHLSKAQIASVEPAKEE